MRVYACVSMRSCLYEHIYTYACVSVCVCARMHVCIALTRPWLKEGLFCSAEAQDPELLRSSRAEEEMEDKVLEAGEPGVQPGAAMNPSLDHMVEARR